MNQRHRIEGTSIKLDGIHHISAITADARRNVNFYSGLLGLRLVKKSVNQDDPTVYHLFYADEKGSPGSDLTFFEYPGALAGRAGAGMVHRITWRVASQQAIDFWTERLASDGVSVSKDDLSIRFKDPEGLDLELLISQTDEKPLIANHPEIPSDFALQGFDGVRAYAADPSASFELLASTLGFETDGPGRFNVSGATRSSTYVYDEAPAVRGLGGSGTVHHVAWASVMDEHERWHERLEVAGTAPTPVIDRYYFRSIYFREPSGVLFEIATIGPGFSVDEDAATLGQRLSLPPQFEPLRDKLETVLTPLPDPRAEVNAR